MVRASLGRSLVMVPDGKSTLIRKPQATGELCLDAGQNLVDPPVPIICETTSLLRLV